MTIRTTYAKTGFWLYLGIYLGRINVRLKKSLCAYYVSDYTWQFYGKKRHETKKNWHKTGKNPFLTIVGHQFWPNGAEPIWFRKNHYGHTMSVIILDNSMRKNDMKRRKTDMKRSENSFLTIFGHRFWPNGAKPIWVGKNHYDHII